MTALVIHVPHAATAIPADVRDQFLPNEPALAAEARESADLHTDALARAAWPEAEIIEAPVSRLVVDVERFPDDAMEPMAKVGRGMIYNMTHDGRSLRRDISFEGRRALRSHWWDPHWERLRGAAAGRVLIDLHSYPRAPWAVEADPSAPRPEIDLGASEGITPPEWLAAMRNHFEAAGYEVGVNTPYEGVIDAGARAAVMLEVRRDVLGAPGQPKWCKLVEACRTAPAWAEGRG